MKTLIVGGTGFAGGNTALHLQQQGYDVTLMGRSRPSHIPGLADMPFVQADYIEDALNGSINDGRLEGFDNLVFCAGNDIKQFPMDGSTTPEAFFKRSNSEAIPAFFEAAKKSGLRRCAYLGTFYPQVAPQQIGQDPYVTSRHEADQAIRAMSSESFNVCSLNAPFILGHLPGLAIPHLQALVHYAQGKMPDLPIFAPEGGTNHMTVQSVAQALQGGLERGESGKAYLIGDANLSWKEYFEQWFTRAGNPQTIEVRSDEHPLLPNMILYAGVGATVSYETDREETALLGYQQGCLLPMIDEVIEVMG
jgi:nucleoside-diphosphate-sugar epimerase